MRKPVPVEKRFWEKVEVRGADECWPWKGQLNDAGYGEIRGSRPKRKHIKAHRVAYTETHGEIAEGMEVCHSCDNPPCCNPAHLFLGTHLDNIADMLQKGRVARGSMLPHAKLTEEQVVSIMARLLTGKERHIDIAKDFGCSDRTVGKIWRGEQWAHVFAPTVGV